MFRIRCSQSLSVYMVQKAAEATGSYSEGHGPLLSGSTLLSQCHVPLHLSPRRSHNSGMAGPADTKWRQTTQRLLCRDILTPTMHAWWSWMQRVLKTCHGHSGFLGWVIHQSCTQPLLLLRHHHYQSWPGRQLVAAGSSHAVFSHNMENILNLSFHWKDKLIEMLCFHSKVENKRNSC